MQPHPTHAVAILGGAISGSEAAFIAAERGVLALVIEQNHRPYGKIEDGLPRWHVSLREKEFARIDANLAHPLVRYVPLTRLGEDLSWAELTEDLPVSAVILAHGAAADRRLPAAFEPAEGRGLVYQSDFVFGFNHANDPRVERPMLPISDRAVVVGGGLASIDCVKIINFTLYGQALAARGIHVDAEQMDQEGLPKILADHGLTREELGVHGATLVYRREARDMPLVSADTDNPARLAKLGDTRVKVLSKVLDKYLAHFIPLASPIAPLLDPQGELVGVQFDKNLISDNRLVASGETFIFETRLMVSSIGSIPEPLDGIERRGELYAWHDRERGRLHATAPIYGLGNVLTGKGNIVESRKNARKIMETLDFEALHGAAQAEAERTVAELSALPALTAQDLAELDAWVERRWKAVGYSGNYREWLAAHPPSGREPESHD